MAREITDIKQFIELSRRSDIKTATIKTNVKFNKVGKKFTETKFKIRGSKNLYTLVVKDVAKSKKLQQSLPPTLTVETL
ncbi:hypothetical protein PACTADRAFT_185529 [Pachysolen tannophilus NRRL Y-2460]|uniref:Large ribosomal subunit protein eL38 n=1 Tax=Pachysolen tannophilus NRRL Y-2460 TaxID=669874 RepID=A0A1E4U251_PACTA|nr:hypothetical protein PACTADRAFT_185529 [Pachysolen tannophilus NRRL Y-2460]